MKKHVLSGVVAMATMAMVAFGQQELMKRPKGGPIYEINVDQGEIGGVANGGTLVYDNSFSQIDPLAACGGVSCEDCGDYYISSIWTTGNARYISDDITLGAGPRALVRYNFLVCGTMAAPTNADITSELWTINTNGLPTAQPGAPIAGTQSTTTITVDSTFPCFIINVKTAPNIILPESLHLVVTSTLQSTSTTGTYFTILDTPNYGSSANQIRRSAAAVNPPLPNTNASWGGAGAFSATPTCVLPGGPDCTTGCAPWANMRAQIYTTGSCGNGTIEPGEQCDGGPCCQSCQIAAAGLQCRASAAPCDATESCDGVSALCPPDGAALAGTPCRPAGGPCDIAEVCDGSSMTCPPDQTITTCANGDGCCPVGCNNGNDNDCAPVGVPTVSEWGLAILTLIGLAVGVVIFRRRAVANS